MPTVYFLVPMSSTAMPVTVEPDAYRIGFIIMTIIAVILFLFIVLMLYLVCKRRGHVEVKTISITPRKKQSVIAVTAMTGRWQLSTGVTRPLHHAESRCAMPNARCKMPAPIA